MTKIETTSGTEQPSGLEQPSPGKKSGRTILEELRQLQAEGKYFPKSPLPKAELTPVEPLNTMQNNTDGQINTLHVDQLATGLTVRLHEWPGMGGETWEVSFTIDGEPVGVMTPVDQGFDSVDVTLPLGDFRYEHGVHFVGYLAKDPEDANDWPGPPEQFYVDIIDPNMDREPEEPLLPADMPDGRITPDYLDQHGSVTFTLPTPADHKDGDTFSFFIDSQEVLTDQPLASPFEVVIPRATFDAMFAGVYKVQYSLTDRAGNYTDMSSAQNITLIKTPAPVLAVPILDSGIAITLAEARDGVVAKHDYATPENGDLVSFLWVTEYQDSYEIPQFLSTTVSFDDILKPGRVYSGTVSYEVNRDGAVYQSPPLSIDVDLDHTGPINPGEPDPINPLLDPAVLTSSSNNTNQIDVADKDQPATITVPLYDNPQIGEMIQVYYSDIGSPVGAPEALDAADIAADELVVNLPWPLIQEKGNGNIRLFYQIYPAGKPENWQQSPDATVVVSVNNIENLPVATFPDRIMPADIINCSHEPWENGVNVLMEYPDFEEDDIVYLDWVLDDTYPPAGSPVPTTPLEQTRREFSKRVELTEATAGKVLMNVPWGDHISIRSRASIVVFWRLVREVGDISGTSDLNYVRLSRTTTGDTVCGPHPDE